MTLRARLTVLTAVLIVAATSLLGVVVYLLAGRIQMDTIDRGLYAEISEARVRSLLENPRPPQDDVYVAVALGRVNRNGDGIRPLRAAGTREQPIPIPPVSAAQIDAATREPITVSAGGLDFRVAVRSHGPGLSTVIAAAPLNSYGESMALLARAILLGAAAVMLLGALASWLSVRGAFRPMNAMVASARQITAGDTGHRLPTSKAGTEIGDLSAAMNVMIDSLAAAIDRVQASEDRLRSFVSAASHEIRTPLPVLRGYAEILGASADDRSPQQQRALERIGAETKRLDELVTGLLVLERSSAPPSGNAERVCVASIARDAFEDLAALEPDRPGLIEVAPAAETALVRGDVEGLRQVFANIVQNIRRHTPGGSAVGVRMSTQDGSIRIVVDDAGPGLTAPQHGTDERPRLDARGTGGFGLGMSIMTAVVHAHAGQLNFDRSPASGLRLTIELPILG
ncbi:MAG: ATP-binding protein [Actinomycetales bacterium]